MDMIYLTFLLLCAYCSVTNTVSAQSCNSVDAPFGKLSDWDDGRFGTSKCWFLKVQNSVILLQLEELKFDGTSCSSAFLKISVRGNETYTFCAGSTNPKRIIALNDVNITYSHRKGHSNRSSFQLLYSLTPEASEISRMNALNWLMNQRTQSFDWGKNTLRASIALYLSDAMTFQDDDFEKELIAKQLQVETFSALLRNRTDPISISELSVLVNALVVTCHNPRRFYGYDLLQIIKDRMALVKMPEPSAYLTLCNLNWTLSQSDVESLINLLDKYIKYPFHQDVQALTVMALTCVKQKKMSFEHIANAKKLYESTITNILSRQLPDGSFGNVYTTALVTQALISSETAQSKQQKIFNAMKYLVKQFNSSPADFLSVYLTLPIFRFKSLVDIKDVDCSNKTRILEKEKEISDGKDEIRRKKQIQYSLYIGDHKDVIYTIYLGLRENCSAYDVMKVAQATDPKYKFLYRNVSGKIYIYEIAGIINDPEVEKFWLLYTRDDYANGTAKHHAESPDKVTFADTNHLIMWYRTAHMYS